MVGHTECLTLTLNVHIPSHTASQSWFLLIMILGVVDIGVEFTEVNIDDWSNPSLIKDLLKNKRSTTSFKGAVCRI